MFSSPLLLIPPLLLPFHGHSHSFQLGSEAMVEIPPVARSSTAAYSVAVAAEGPWSSQVGHRAYSTASASEGPWLSQVRHRAYSVAAASEGPWLGRARQLMHDYVTGSQETGRSNGFPLLDDSDPGREKSRPPLYRFWKLNAVGLTLLTLSLCSPICLMVPRLGGQGSGGGDFTYRVPPSWSPENEQHYSFRAWCQDLQLWLMLTDLQPAQPSLLIRSRMVE